MAKRKAKFETFNVDKYLRGGYAKGGDRISYLDFTGNTHGVGFPTIVKDLSNTYPWLEDEYRKYRDSLDPRVDLKESLEKSLKFRWYLMYLSNQ